MFTFAMPLQEWLCSFGTVHSSSDSDSYIRNLQTTMVAFDVDVRDKLVVNSSPPSDTTELVLRVIEKKIRQGEKNVLTQGFGMMSDDPDAQVSCFTNIEYRHPNSSVNLLQRSVWKKLHHCIGDVWMRALLEETAIFTKCSQTCYIQLTGTPVFVKSKSETGLFVKKSVKKDNQGTGKHHRKRKQDWQAERRKCQKRRRTEDLKEPCAKKMKMIDDEIVLVNRPEAEKLPAQEPTPSFNPYKYHLYLAQSYLYSSDYREKFPASHVLSQAHFCLYEEICTVDVTGSMSPPYDTNGHPPISAPRITVPHLLSLEELLQSLQQNHEACKYWTYLNTCCPVVSVKKKLTIGRRRNLKIPDHVLLKDCVPPQKVYIFLRKVFIEVVPLQIVGCLHNRNHFLKAIKTLVYLGRFEKMCVGDLLNGIKTKTIPWLKTVSPHCLKLHLLAKVFYWLMNDFIITLIKVFFYVTETATFRNQLLFYRKRVWSKLHSNGIKDLRKKGVLTSVKKTAVTASLQNGSCLGEAFIRFLPKLRSLRPIANLGRQTPPIAKSALPINKQLMNVLTVLSYLTSCDPSWIGAAKFGTDDIFLDWKEFALNWKKDPERNHLYFVKTDIKACFDGILQEKLLEIIEDFLSQAPDEDVIVRKFVSHYASDCKVVCKFKKIASGFDGYISDFEKFIQKFIEDNKLCNMVFVNQMINQQMHLEEVFEKLQCHIQNNIIKIGRQYFKQSIGISQGSVLSTLLCNIYYGQMERTFMPPQDDELLMRMVDDSLFVTPSRERAELFLCKMIKGNSEYNFSINADKILVNFDYQHETCGMMKKTPGDWFPWCGMLFNTKTLEVGSDLTRYQGIRMRHTLTVDVSVNPGRTMKRKLLMSLRPKCHAIFLDTELNSTEVCVSNCYRLLLLTAFKFHCYVSCLPDKQRVKDNPGFFHTMIYDIGCYFYSQASVQSVRKFGDKFLFDVPSDVMQWLCWYAFTMKMKCHSSSYKRLIQMMKQSLKSTEKLLRKKDKTIAKSLKRVCGRNIPVELKAL